MFSLYGWVNRARFWDEGEGRMSQGDKGAVSAACAIPCQQKRNKREEQLRALSQSTSFSDKRRIIFSHFVHTKGGRQNSLFVIC